jgi:hypothetical protein
MIDQLTTQFYQRKSGEIFVVVQGWKNDSYVERLIANVEKFKYSSEALYELSLAGFDNFNLFNSEDYNGYGFSEMLEKFGVESGEAKLIASISTNCGSELFFESMNEYAKSLFSPVLDWIKEF